MKKYLILMIGFLSFGFLYADQIDVQNQTGFRACFMMYFKDGLREGPVCIEPNFEMEFVYSDPYFGISAYVVQKNGKQEDIFIADDLKDRLQNRSFKYHRASVIACSNPADCEGRKFKLIKVEVPQKKEPKNGFF